jgi:hypothetical protein
MPSVKVLKSFRAHGELHVPGTVLDVAETSLGKLAGFVKLLPDIASETAENSVEVIAGHDARKTMGEVIPFPSRWFKSFNETQLERLAIMTVDGGLTDDEALKATKFCGRLLPLSEK